MLENRVLIEKYVFGHIRKVRKMDTLQFAINGFLRREGLHTFKNIVTLG